jgi:glycine hydroxymethyltransferase
MSRADPPGGLSTRTVECLARAARQLQQETPLETAERIARLTAEHETWRGKQALNLNAAEGVMSRGARRLLASDLATRVTEGTPGDKIFPHALQNRYVDEIEGTLIEVARKLFEARFVEWRPLTTSMANAAVFSSLTSPGDTILVQSQEAGGNYSYNAAGFPPLIGLKVEPLPWTGSCFELDMEKAAEAVRRVRPRLIVVGGSNVMFPYKVRDLRSLADEVGATLLYDAAHISLLIAAGIFQRPLKEGAHLMTISTHKIMGGAVGGMVLTDDGAIAEAVLKTVFPPMLQTRDQNKYAATAYAFAEHLEFGRVHAEQIVANVRALGAAMEEAGFEVFGADRGYSRTHQLFLRHPTVDVADFEERCQRANILAARTARTAGVLGGKPGGVIRLSVQEISRQGLIEVDMPRVARLIRAAVTSERPAEDIAREIEDWMSGLGPLHFSFDNRLGLEA